MRSFWRLLAYILPYRPLVIGNIISNLFTAIFTIVSVPTLIPFIQILFDRTPKIVEKPDFQWNVHSINQYANYQFSQWVLLEGKEQALIKVCVLIVLLFFFKNFFRYLSAYFIAPVRYGIIRDIRKQLFDKFLSLPLSYFSEERKGDLLSRTTADVQEIEWSILNVLEAIFREPLIIVGSLAFMIYVSPTLMLFALVLMLFTGLIIGGISKQLKHESGAAQARLGSLVSVIEEALSGLRIIKSFNAEKYQAQKFGVENNAYSDLIIRILRRRDMSSPLSEFLGIGVVSVLLWYGSRLVFMGNLQAETFLTFIFAFYNIIDPAKSLASAHYHVQKGMAAVNRIDEVLYAENVIKEAENALPITEFKDKIQYQDVSFSYKKEDRMVLNHINLTISKGKIIAVVGASGSGKSTLVDLLPRFYDVTQGKIVIDNENVRQYRIKDLRHLIGIVSQEAILFNDTIYNNIVFGIENTTPQQVENAARIANAHDFIVATENGYQTNIGDRGSKLSGGQRQRLTIARAVLKNPPILILDEATSALDSESEKLVQDALANVMRNRTSVVIAHRLSTIQFADEIIVLKDGQIVERGSHEQLLSKMEGEYRKLVEMQHVGQ